MHPGYLLGRVSSVLNPVINLAAVTAMALSGVVVSTVLQGLHFTALGMGFGPVDSLFSLAGILCVGSGLYVVIRLRPSHATRAGDAPAIATP